MKQVQHSLSLRPREQGLYEVTGEIAAWLTKQPVTEGLLTVFIRHTSAAHRLFGKPRRDFAGDFIKSLSPRTHRQSMLDLFHGSPSPRPSLAALFLAA